MPDLLFAYSNVYTLRFFHTTDPEDNERGRFAPVTFGSRVLGCGLSSLSLGVAQAHSGLAAFRPCRADRSRATSPSSLVSRSHACFVKQYAVLGLSARPLLGGLFTRRASRFDWLRAGDGDEIGDTQAQVDAALAAVDIDIVEREGAVVNVDFEAFVEQRQW